MYRLYLAAADMLPAAVLLVPAYYTLNRVYLHDFRKSILYYLFSCYLSAVYVLVGLPTITYIRPELDLNLIPIAGVADDLKNSFLNVLLFAPLGIMLPLLWSEFRTVKSTVKYSFITSLAIELLQILTYRVTDINDLITNTCGSLLGYYCTKILFAKFPASKHFTKNTERKELTVILSVVLLLMFFVYPFISAALWNFILS